MREGGGGDGERGCTAKRRRVAGYGGGRAVFRGCFCGRRGPGVGGGRAVIGGGGGAVLWEEVGEGCVGSS